MKRFDQPSLFQSPKPPDYRARRRELRQQVKEQERKKKGRRRAEPPPVSIEDAVKLAEWVLGQPAVLKDEKK